MARLLKSIRRKIILFFLNFIFLYKRINVDISLVGSKYGNWYIPNFLINKKNLRGICLTGGVGEDLSFEYILSSKSNLEFLLYDFTPRSIQYFKICKNNDKFGINTEDGILQLDSAKLYNMTLIEAGLSDQNCEYVFYPPKNDAHVSWSNEKNENNGVKFPVKNIHNIIEAINIKDRLICKLDIEGSEWNILKNKKCASSVFTFKIILLEMDFLKSCSLINAIKYIFKIIYHSSGFNIFYIDDYNIGFIKK
jgi:FkbM family methyltransferase